MADKMDRSLDEILAEKKKDNSSRPRRGGSSRGNGPAPRRDRRDDYPRDGVRKSYRDEPRRLDDEWVHDRYEEYNSRRPAPRRRESPDGSGARGSRIRVENIHYELTEEDLTGLFNRIGPVVKLDIRYDRAGRSEGTAFVTYEDREDALQAIKEFDGANANGQPIRLTFVGGGPGLRVRNPFDSAVMPGRSLADRITDPHERSRSHSPTRYDEDDAARKGIDRYIPGRRSRSPMPRRRGGGGGGSSTGTGGGRRPGARREGGGRDSQQQQEDGGRGGSRRPRKTQEELDAEMDDYFGGGTKSAAAAPAVDLTANGGIDHRDDDTDMIE